MSDGCGPTAQRRAGGRRADRVEAAARTKGCWPPMVLLLLATRLVRGIRRAKMHRNMNIYTASPEITTIGRILAGLFCMGSCPRADRDVHIEMSE